MEHDDLTPINSYEDAISVARSWAHEHDMAVRNFENFARNWYLQTPPQSRVRLHLRGSLRSFSSVCKHYAAEWNRHAVHFADLASSWNLETVKHLAVFNVAGIAGAAALLTNANYSSQLTTKLSLPLFAIGLILALVTFWTNMRGYALSYRHAEMQRRIAGTATSWHHVCLLYTSPSPRDLSTSRMPSSA